MPRSSVVVLPSSTAAAPADLCALQDVLATEAVAHLRDAGYRAVAGEYGDLRSAELLLQEGRRLVLVPMAETVWGDSERPDADTWFVLLREADGQYLEFDDEEWPEDECLSVLWARRMGLDPATAVALVDAALADERMRAHFDLQP